MYRSIKKGLNLGLINEIRVLTNPSGNPSQRYKQDPLLEKLMKECGSKFPAKKLLGVTTLDAEKLAKEEV